MISDSITVRVATVSDMPAMIAVINAAFIVESFVEGTRTDHERLSAMMEKGTFLLAHDHSGQLVASVYVENRGDRSYLGMLAVHPVHQDRGWGRVMTGAAEEHARKQGCRAIDLTVLSLRAELLPFYRKLWYEAVGTDEFRPSRPLKAGVECHCIKMSKEL
jgi:ribosomal protein S18 acetylase RimI-like enzyme